MALEVSKIYEPTLLVDLKKLERNVQLMRTKCNKNELKLLPHFKTHQSAQIGAFIAKQDIDGVTVSSLKMAIYFAQNGFKRIHLAMPPLKTQNSLIAQLANEVDLSINVSCSEHLGAIADISIKVLVDLDPDYGRTGIDINDTKKIKELFTELSQHYKLHFSGFYVHNGATYKGDTMALHQNILKKLHNLKSNFNEDIPVFYGDTPGCSIATDFSGISHITAGNFVFYDLMQAELGSCFENQIAVCMATPIIEKNARSQQFVVHGGAVHFSKDHIQNQKGQTIYGKMVHLSNKGWSTSIVGCEMVSLSQEHGLLKVNNEIFEQYKVGDVVGVLPVHSCLTADCTRQFVSFDGNSIGAMPR